MKTCYLAYMIQEYRFGSITVNGKNYTEDVEVRWTNEVLDWTFRERHLINVEEVKRAVEQNPEIIVIGTGEPGLAEVTEETKEFIRGKGIELIVDKTEDAVKTFNVINEESLEEEGRQKKIIGLFHLTC